jgi:hypothetical protein
VIYFTLEKKEGVTFFLFPTSVVQAEHASAQALHALPSRARGSRRAGSAGS